MEQLIYKYDNTTITKEIDGLDSDEFLKELIDLMIIVGYSRESIEKSLNNITID